MEVSAPNPRGRAARIERLDGHSFERAGAHGKHLLLHFGELVLHSHLGMSGSWHIYRRGEPWRKPVGAAWAVLSSDRRRGGPVRRPDLAAAARRGAAPRPGPRPPRSRHPRARTSTPSRSPDRCADVPDRSLGDALLDQHLVAGIGNIFKSEACFAARLDPWQRVGDVSDEQLRARRPGRPRSDARRGRATAARTAPSTSAPAAPARAAAPRSAPAARATPTAPPTGARAARSPRGRPPSLAFLQPRW